MNRGLGRSGTYLLGGLGTLTPLPAPEFFSTEVEVLMVRYDAAVVTQSQDAIVTDVDKSRFLVDVEQVNIGESVFPVSITTKEAQTLTLPATKITQMEFFIRNAFGTPPNDIFFSLLTWDGGAQTIDDGILLHRVQIPLTDIVAVSPNWQKVTLSDLAIYIPAGQYSMIWSGYFGWVDDNNYYGLMYSNNPSGYAGGNEYKFFSPNWFIGADTDVVVSVKGTDIFTENLNIALDDNSSLTSFGTPFTGEQLAQTLTFASTTKLDTLGLWLNVNSGFPTDDVLADFYEWDGVSDPDAGTLLATATYPAASIPDWEVMLEAPLGITVPAGQYAIVIRRQGSLSWDYWVTRWSSTAGYSGGNAYRRDNGVWQTIATDIHLVLAEQTTPDIEYGSKRRIEVVT